jgi:hypothetical protein
MAKSDYTVTAEPADLIWGAVEIGKAIHRSPRQAFHLLERGILPGRKIGGRWCASRRKLLAALVGDDESGAS